MASLGLCSIYNKVNRDEIVYFEFPLVKSARSVSHLRNSLEISKFQIFDT